jgi:transposase InsO family protein
MKLSPQVWHWLVLVISGWINRSQQESIEYLKLENRILREVVGKKRILLNDNQRRRLAVKGKLLGRAKLKEIGTLFTPDTILRWHRQLIARKFDSSHNQNRVGRPRIRQVIVDTVVRMAKENSNWGYRRIQGSLANVGYNICESTIANILKSYGIEPAPDRGSTGSWSTFLKAHWDSIAAIDFTTVEVWTLKGLVTYYLLFVIDLKSRKVHLAGVTPHPTGEYMNQMARNLSDCRDGFLKDHTVLLMDRDTKFTAQFRETLKFADVKPIRLPPFSPNMNAFIERFFRSLKSECLNRMIFFGDSSLRHALKQYLEHYHSERNHQGIGNQLIESSSDVQQESNSDESIPIERHQRLGGMLNFYRRAA